MIENDLKIAKEEMFLKINSKIKLMRIFKEDRILIAGSEGMVGRSIRRALLKKDYGGKGGGQILGISRKQLDLSDQKKYKIGLRKIK